MIKIEEYKQLKAFARQDGAILGILWIASFACFVVSTQSPIMSMLFEITLFLTPFLVYTCLRKYRDDVAGGMLSYRRGFGYSMLIFIYASLLLAIAQWAYFEFIDQGRLVGGMIAVSNSQEMKPVYDAYGLTKKEVDQQLQLLAETRPIDIAFTFMCMNIIAGTILGGIIALLSQRTIRIHK